MNEAGGRDRWHRRGRRGARAAASRAARRRPNRTRRRSRFRVGECVVTAMRAPVVAGSAAGSAPRPWPSRCAGTTPAGSPRRGGRTSWSAAAHSTRCAGPRPSSRPPDPDGVSGAGGHPRRARERPAGRCGHAWSCSNRPRRGGAAAVRAPVARRSRTRWPRPHTCSQNRPIGCPGSLRAYAAALRELVERGDGLGPPRRGAGPSRAPSHGFGRTGRPSTRALPATGASALSAPRPPTARAPVPPRRPHESHRAVGRAGDEPVAPRSSGDRPARVGGTRHRSSIPRCRARRPAAAAGGADRPPGPSADRAGHRRIERVG